MARWVVAPRVGDEHGARGRHNRTPNDGGGGGWGGGGADGGGDGGVEPGHVVATRCRRHHGVAATCEALPWLYLILIMHTSYNNIQLCILYTIIMPTEFSIKIITELLRPAKRGNGYAS